MKVYVTRDRGTDQEHLIYIWDRKPENFSKDEEKREWGSGEGFSFQGIPLAEFRREFDFSPDKGYCKEVDMSLARCMLPVW